MNPINKRIHTSKRRKKGVHPKKIRSDENNIRSNGYENPV